MAVRSNIRRGLPRAAIITTLKNPGPSFGSYLDYHLSVGFDHIFLFFDDPNDPAIQLASAYPQVTIIRSDAALRERWRRTKSYELFPAVREFAEKELIPRQVLNMEVGIELALERGIDWLLHIDCDELFHATGQTAPEHFQKLEEAGVERAIYANYEALIETADIHDPFREVTLFKRNPRVISAGPFSETQKQLIARLPQLPEKFFLFYSNGKAAARVRRGLIPAGVHAFQYFGQKARPMRAWRGGEFDASRPGPRLRRYLLERFSDPRLLRHRCEVVTGEPRILHYACCGFESFWTKYVTLGKFADTWFGETDIRQRIGDFHLDARDIVMTGDRQAAREFYLRRAVIRDAAVADELIESGLCSRITDAADLLNTQRLERELEQNIA